MAGGAEGDSLARALGRPAAFSGQDDAWEEWSFIFRGYMVLNTLCSDEELREIEGTDRIPDLLLENLGPVHETMSKRMYYVLATFLRGSGLLVLRKVGIGEGYIAWRALHDKYNAPTRGRNFATLQAILQPSQQWPKDAVGFEEALGAWEIIVIRYETATGERLQEQIKLQVLIGQAPKEIRTQLLLQSYATYEAARNAVMAYLESSRVWNPSQVSGRPTPHDDMDVGSINALYGKGGGKRERWR
jgi:hypothetical protein